MERLRDLSVRDWFPTQKVSEISLCITDLRLKFDICVVNAVATNEFLDIAHDTAVSLPRAYRQ